MNLGTDYKLEADSQNLILYKKITPEQEAEEMLVAMANGDDPDGEIVSGAETKWKRCGFFTSLEGVFHYIMNKQIVEGINLKPLEELLKGQQELSLLIVGLDLKSFSVSSLRNQPKPASSSQIIKENTQEQQEESLPPSVLTE